MNFLANLIYLISEIYSGKHLKNNSLVAKRNGIFLIFSIAPESLPLISAIPSFPGFPPCASNNSFSIPFERVFHFGNIQGTIICKHSACLLGIFCHFQSFSYYPLLMTHMCGISNATWPSLKSSPLPKSVLLLILYNLVQPRWCTTIYLTTPALYFYVI